MLGQVEQPAAALAEHELIAIDQVVEHLRGDGGEAAQAGAILAGGQGIGSELADGAAVAFPVVLGNRDLGLDDGRFQLLELGLVGGGLRFDLRLEGDDVLGERLDLGLDLGEGGALRLDGS